MRDSFNFSFSFPRSMGERQPPTTLCTHCFSLLCTRCVSKIHFRGQRPGHIIRPLPSPVALHPLPFIFECSSLSRLVRSAPSGGLRAPERCLRLSAHQSSYSPFLSLRRFSLSLRHDSGVAWRGVALGGSRLLTSGSSGLPCCPFACLRLHFSGQLSNSASSAAAGCAVLHVAVPGRQS